MNNLSDKELLNKIDEILFWLEQSFVNSDDDGDSGDEEQDEIAESRKKIARNLLQENYPEMIAQNNDFDYESFTAAIDHEPVTSTPKAKKVRKNALTDLGFQFIGTIRENRTEHCPLKTEKELKKEGRGAYDWKIDANSGTAVVKWLDRKPVCCISNYKVIEPIDTCKRWSEKDKKKIDIQRPTIVTEYKKYMGGVNKNITGNK